MEIKFLETREIYVSETRFHDEIMKFIVQGRDGKQITLIPSRSPANLNMKMQ